MEDKRVMKVQPITKGQPTFTNSNPKPLFKGQMSPSKTEDKEFEKVLKEIQEENNKNTGFKGTKRGEIPQMPQVSTPLKPNHKLEDPYPSPKPTTSGKLNFIA